MAELHITSICLENNCKIRCSISINGEEDAIYAVVSDNVVGYLDEFRADAFVVGMLYFAMSHECDIRSDVPISDELYYNLDNHFIDALSHQDSGLYRTRLLMSTIPAAEKTVSIVATGISCGVDCLHTIYVNEHIQMPSFRITHLAFYNVGSHQTGKNDVYDSNLRKGRFDLCKSFADEYGYTFYTIDSNIHEVIERHGGYSHINNHSYMASFCILLLQKGISRYFYSAGYPYTDFRVYKSYKNEVLDSAMYDLLTFFCISIGGLKVYSAGGNIKRIDKTRLIASYKPAQKYLNVCVNSPRNDGVCFKCIRTLLSIDATGNVDDFKSVFDVEKYRANKSNYIRKMWFDATFMHDELCEEIEPLYKKELSFPVKMRAICENWKLIARKLMRR